MLCYDMLSIPFCCILQYLFPTRHQHLRRAPIQLQVHDRKGIGRIATTDAAYIRSTACTTGVWLAQVPDLHFTGFRPHQDQRGVGRGHDLGGVGTRASFTEASSLRWGIYIDSVVYSNQAILATSEYMQRVLRNDQKAMTEVIKLPLRNLLF
jgi:hypothetical protein